MANFAVIDGINVLNIIIADSKEIAEEITGKTCIEYSDADKAQPGGTYEKELFIPRKPFPSWTLNKSKNEWEAPVARPLDDKLYFWNEEITSWVEETPTE